LKRVALKIVSKFHPEQPHSGYALVNELNEQTFSFFCTEKFSLDEELEVHMHFGGHELTYKVQMNHLHEQISSGRIMNALPTAENPFPARKFYRCFGKVLELQGMDGVTDQSNPEGTQQPEAVPTATEESSAQAA